jgi:putative ABC transport system substrate-binding protein
MHRRAFLVASAAACLTPRAVAAQPSAKVYRVGFLAFVPGEDTGPLKALRERLRELGYREGQNIARESRSAEGRLERLPSLAAELVRARPDVLIAGFGTLAAQAAKGASTTVPIVFVTVGDPVGAGLIASLGRPGGNVTGLSGLTETGGKRLQLLQEIVPGKPAIAVLVNPETPFTRLALHEIKTAADAGGTRLLVAEARTGAEVSGQLEEALRAGAGGLLVVEDPLMFSLRRHICDLATRLRIPAVYTYRDYAEAGGLMSYGADRRDLYRRTADYVDRILRGARPADLPVEQPAKLELVINLKTAAVLGVKIPPSLLLRADQVID